MQMGWLVLTMLLLGFVAYLALRPTPVISTVPGMPKFMGRFFDTHDGFKNWFGFMTLAFAGFQAFSRRRPPGRAAHREQVVWAAFCTALTCVFELAQLWIPHRTSDWRDILSGCAGIGSAFALTVGLGWLRYGRGLRDVPSGRSTRSRTKKGRRFLAWGINYAPEKIGIALYNTLLCEGLKSFGHDVEIVTSFAYYPQWRIQPEDKGHWFRTDLRNGIPVHRCWQYVPRRPSALKRMAHELSFVATSLTRVLVLPRPDLYIVVSPPLLLGLAAFVASILKRAPFVFHVQDMQPDAASTLGMVRSGPLLRLLYFLEATAYRSAAGVSAITPGMVRAIERKGVPASKLALLPNAVELSESPPAPQRGRFRERMGFSTNQILMVYSGNLGVKQGVEILLEAARHVRDPRLHTIICGDGARREVLENRARELGIRNVTFLPLQPERKYQEMLVDADIYLVTQLPGSGSLFFPSKLLTGLAMSKAMLIVADAGSEVTQAARKGKFAIVVNPSEPKDVAAAQEYLAQNPQQREFLGQNGRHYVQQFDLKLVLPAFEQVLCGLAASHENQSKVDAEAEPLRANREAA
jgi:colanic acid biosynthesis glycosyl transferase WcaI